MNSDTVPQSAAEISAAVRDGSMSAEESVHSALRRVEAAPQLNAVITLCAERALEGARRRPQGPLADGNQEVTA